MNTDLNMKVNVLPVYTYNFLHVNDSTLSFSDISIDTCSGPEADEVPVGVSLERKIPFDKAGDVFRKNRSRIMSISDDFVMPNGDTSDRDAEQAVRTGLGIDVDRLFVDLSATTDIYTVSENTVVSKPVILRFNMQDPVRNA